MILENYLEGIKLTRELGIGGMGTVHLGHDVNLDRQVAVKLLKPELADHPVYREAFLREAQACARIKHPNIVPIFGLGETFRDGCKVYFIVMEYVAGGSLMNLLAHSPLSWRDTLRLAHDLSSALKCSHALRLIHGDLKPSNVLIHEDQRFVLGDFGLARSFEQEGMGWGSKAYCSPDRLRTARPTTMSDDLFALGIVLHESITGTRRIQEQDQMLWPSHRRIVNNVMSASHGVPPDLACLIGRLLSSPMDSQAIRDAEEVHELTEKMQQRTRIASIHETGPISLQGIPGSPISFMERVKLSGILWILGILLWCWILISALDEQGIRTDPGMSDVHFISRDAPTDLSSSLENPSLDRALILEERGLLDEAVLAAKNATIDSPEDPLPLYHLGKLLVALERYPEALDSLRKSLAGATTFRRILWRLQFDGDSVALASKDSMVAWHYRNQEDVWIVWSREWDGHPVRRWNVEKGWNFLERVRPLDAAVLRAGQSELVGFSPNRRWRRNFRGRTIRSAVHSQDRVLVDFVEGGQLWLDASTGKIQDLSCMLASTEWMNDSVEMECVQSYMEEGVEFRQIKGIGSRIEAWETQGPQSLLWSITAPRQDETISFILTENALVWADEDGRLHAVCKRTGNAHWMIDLWAPCRSLLAGKTLVLASDMDGNQVAIHPTPSQGSIHEALEANILLFTGKALKGLGQWEDALRTLETLVQEVEPSFSDAYLELADILDQLGRTSESEEAALLAAQIDEPGSSAWTEAARFLRERDRSLRLEHLLDWKEGGKICATVRDGSILVASEGRIWFSNRDSDAARPIWTGIGSLTSSLPSIGISAMSELFLWNGSSGLSQFTMPYPIVHMLKGPPFVLGMKSKEHSVLVAWNPCPEGILWSLDLDGEILALWRVDEDFLLAETQVTHDFSSLTWIALKGLFVREQRSIASKACHACLEKDGFIKIFFGKDKQMEEVLRGYSTEDGRQIWRLDFSPAVIESVFGDPIEGHCAAILRKDRMRRCIYLDARSGIAKWISNELPSGETRFLGMAGDQIWIGCGRRALSFHKADGSMVEDLLLPSTPSVSCETNGETLFITRRGEIVRSVAF